MHSLNNDHRASGLAKRNLGAPVRLGHLCICRLGVHDRMLCATHPTQPLTDPLPSEQRPCLLQAICTQDDDVRFYGESVTRLANEERVSKSKRQYRHAQQRERGSPFFLKPQSPGTDKSEQEHRPCTNYADNISISSTKNCLLYHTGISFM